ncbi:MAG: hypothetical protein KAS67_03215 [Thermoplasmata archaeon]|nr:hypothetical protein [Thermoplasmata archaeon]
MIDPATAATVATGVLACKETIATTKKIKDDSEEAISWIENVKKKLGPYKPEVTNFDINYKTRRSELKLSLTIPKGLRRNTIGKIEIPAYNNFQIKEMIDNHFQQITGVWEFQDGRYIFKTNQLPKSSESFLLTLNGKISDTLLNYLIRIQPSTNPNKDNNTDQYWLACHLKDTNILKGWWDALSIREIDIGIKVAIQRCFTNSVPKDVMERLEAQREWNRQGAARRFDRQGVFQAFRYGRRARAASVLDIDEIYKLIVEISSAQKFEEYLSVERPFDILGVEEDKNFDFYPERMNVDVITALNSNNPTAEGNLTFKRKEYEESIKSVIEKEKEKKKPTKKKGRRESPKDVNLDNVFEKSDSDD